MGKEFEVDLEALRSVKRRFWMYGVIHNNSLYLKIYRVLDSAEKRYRKGMGKALAAFVLGMLAVLAAIGFAAYYGFLPRGVQVVSLSTGGSTSTTTAVASGGGSIGASAASTTVFSSISSNSSGVIGSALGYLFSKIGSYIVGSKGAVAGFFTWLLGSSLADAIANLIVLVVVAGIIYWLMKFFKWIIVMVVFIDVVLIILKYVLVVI
jgi:hypothetical protein